ncbi:MAG: triosephosphate isomerase [Thermomicrobiales bacterium]|nr:triosephosphate isomerase [Thermomicrobiales bacterium]
MSRDRCRYFGTNFKMHQTPAESAQFYVELAAMTGALEGVQLFVIPPCTSLATVVAASDGHRERIWIGAQNMYWAPEGAYTGEISGPMLAKLGVDLVLLGHAERREHFHETDVELNKKVLAGIACGLRVLLCVGETAEERSFGVGAETISRQLKIDLHHFPVEAVDRLLIAYEPVWSIGEGGVPANPADVEAAAKLIRAVLTDLLGPVGGVVPLLYGGSVNPGNAAGFAALPDIDGLFVGRAAWSVPGFRDTLDAALMDHQS